MLALKHPFLANRFSIPKICIVISLSSYSKMVIPICINATGFRETLRSDIDIGRFQPPGQRNPNMNLVIVSHGLTLRVFLMRWYKWTVEQFEGLNNLGNGKMVVMEKGYGGR